MPRTAPAHVTLPLTVLTALATTVGTAHAGSPDGAFASTPVPTTAKPVASTRFAAGEPIYGRLFLAGRLDDQFATVADVEVVIGEYSRCRGQIHRKDLDATESALTSLPIYLSVEPEALPDVARDRDLRTACLDWPSALDPGTYKGKVTLTGDKLRYTAAFELVVTPESRAAWKERAARFVAATNAKAEAERAAARPMPKAGRKDKKLEAQILAGWRKLGRAGKPGKVVIENADWVVETTAVGAPISRGVLAWVVLTMPDGTCALDGVDVTQPWNGKAYGKSQFEVDNAPRPLDCAKTK
jgi:hypothetical protein